MAKEKSRATKQPVPRQMENCFLQFMAYYIGITIFVAIAIGIGIDFDALVEMLLPVLPEAMD